MSYGTSLTIAPGQPMPSVENRVTTPEEPGRSAQGAHDARLSHAYWYLGWGDTWREGHITHDTAMTYSAVWGCVRVIAQSLASVGWHVYEQSIDGRSKLPIENNEAWLLSLQPNPEQGAFDWRQCLLKDALLWGNGYAEIERTNSGRANWLWRLSPDRMSLVRDDAGQLWYQVAAPQGIGNPTYLRPENVFHLKGLGPDGLVGWSAVTMARKSIDLGMKEESFGLDYFGRGTMPGGAVSIPKNMTPKQRDEFRRSFEEVYSGSANAHRVVVLSDGVTFTPTSIPNEDAQFLESRKFQVTEICRWYGVPPHKLADLDRATFSNIEEQETAFVRDCLLPWACRLEGEADLKLFGPVKRGRRFTKLNLDALMRGNSMTQTDTVVRKVTSALMTVNEGRAYLDLNPIEGGDTPLIQGAMVPLERVLEEPEPEPPPTPPTQAEPPELPEEDDAEDATDPTEDMAARQRRHNAIRGTFLVLLTETYSRLYRVDGDKAQRAARKGPAALARHAAEYYGDGATDRVGAVLRPVVEAAVAALGNDPNDAAELASILAGRHVHDCAAEMAALAESPALWESRPAEAAAAAMAEIMAWDESQVDRDDDGQFSDGGGGGGGKSDEGAGGDKQSGGDQQKDSGKKEAREAKRAQEDSQRHEQRSGEDAKRQESRDAEDSRRESARQKEDEADDHDEQQTQQRRDAEDSERDSRIEREDADRESKRAAEDDERDSKRAAEDAAFDAEDAALDQSRKEEDDARSAQREKEDDAIEQAHEREEISDAERMRQHQANDRKREKDDAATDRERERQDAAREKDRERIDKQRAKEDEATESKRNKEDEATERTRSREEESRDRGRKKEDDASQSRRDRREASRQKEDAATEAKRDKEDEAIDRAREKEDEEIEKARDKEDKQ